MKTCNDCIHKSVCYRTDSVSSSYADKCGEFKSEKIGHWVKKSQYGNDYCSECGYELLMRGNPKYCPNCGARMSESKFFAKVAESYCKGLQDGLTAESEETE